MFNKTKTTVVIAIIILVIVITGFVLLFTRKGSVDSATGAISYKWKSPKSDETPAAK